MTGRSAEISHSPCRNARELPIQGQENLAVLTITIIFALLVALWGRIGLVRPH